MSRPTSLSLFISRVINFLRFLNLKAIIMVIRRKAVVTASVEPYLVELFFVSVLKNPSFSSSSSVLSSTKRLNFKSSLARRGSR